MDIRLNINRLKECREKKGITKMEAAKRMNLSQPAYVRYENGDRTPSFQTLQTIANALDTSVEYLTDQTNNSSPNLFMITKEENPDLFELVELCNTEDKNNDYIKRIMQYAKTLSQEI